MSMPKCADRDGECFARDAVGFCTALRNTDWPCSFKKPDARVTKGVKYVLRDPLETKSPRKDRDDVLHTYVELEPALHLIALRTGFSEAYLRSVISSVERIEL